jgi:predicted kinase
VLAEYQRMSGDHVPDSLLSFYRCYRAIVRAKVALLRSQQQTSNTATASGQLVGQYIDLAEQYAKRLGPPTLLIVGGLMGSGKSTLAAKLAEAFAIKLISTDHIRHYLIGSSASPAKYGEGNYRPDMRRRVYDEMFRQVDEQLTDGQSVILDGTFLTCCLRDRAYELANRHGAVSLHVQCTCARPIAYARIAKRAEARRSEFEARTELYDLQAHELEPPWADEPAITIDTTSALPEQFRAVCAELKRLASA